MYHIFTVEDYKGGEQSYSINLTEEELLSELCKAFCYDLEFPEPPTAKTLKETCTDRIEERSSNYAGGDGVVMSIFETTKVSRKLIEKSIDDYVDKLIDYILKYEKYDMVSKSED